MTPPELPVLWRDDQYVAIDKPSGLLVHPSELAPGEPSCLKILRDQLGFWLYPVHRLDRATSGVLVFALSSDAARALMTNWEGQVRKTYQAIVRGWTDESGVIDRPLRESPDKEHAPARTEYRRVETREYADAVGPFATTRYAWVEARPLTGRQHQIRKHLRGISHPIVGDTMYGDGDHNRYFRTRFGSARLLLHASRLELIHPASGERLPIDSRAEWPPAFWRESGPG